MKPNTNQNKNTVNPTKGSAPIKDTEKNPWQHAQNSDGSFQPHNIQKEALGPNTKR
jgi:hypothetical protein